MEIIEQSIIIRMDSNEHKKPRKYERVVRQSKYSFICLEKRVELIELVAQQNMSIYQASRLLGINNATAKDIIRKYKKNGTVFIRKSEAQHLQQRSEMEPQDSYQAPSAKSDEFTDKNKPERLGNEQAHEVPPETFQVQPFMMHPCVGMMFYYWS